MRELELWLTMAALIGFALGGWGILWARIGQASGRTSWGRALSVGALVFLGAGSVVAAFHRADGLVPLGLSAGFLVVGLLWGESGSDWGESAASSYAPRG